MMPFLSEPAVLAGLGLVLATLIAVILYAIRIKSLLGAFPALEKTHALPPHHLPKVVVHVSLHNQAHTLPAFLHSIRQQLYPPGSVTWWFTNDASTDEGSEMLKRFAQENRDLDVHMFHNTKQMGKKANLLAAIARCTEPIMLLTDADVVLPPVWLAAMVSRLQNPGCALVVGPVAQNLGSHTGLDGFQEVEYACLSAITLASANAGNPLMASACSMAFKPACLPQGEEWMHREWSSGDDVFLLHAMVQQHGAQAVCAAVDAQATVCTQPAPSFVAYLKQRVRWAGKSKAYPAQATARFAALVWSVHALMAICFLLFPKPALAALAIKIASDYALFSQVGTRLGATPQPFWRCATYSALQVPLYTLVGIAALLAPKQNKGWTPHQATRPHQSA